MSIPQNIEIEKNLSKPYLNYRIGDAVFLKSDEGKKYPMQIVGYDLDDFNCSDYLCTWLNSQGKVEKESFPEECLILKK